jgi:hypothetical protein
LVPALIPFTFHRYTGADPPLIGVAVNDMEVPAQQGLVEAVTDIPTGCGTVTDNVI